MKLLADNGISDDGDGWIASAKEQVLVALHRAGEASTRQLGEVVSALRQPIELSPGKPYAGTQHAHGRIMLHLGLEGVVVRGRPMGSWINSQYRWAAMDDWLPGGIVGMDPREASGQLVRRWLHAFGPGATADVRWWTGWTVRDTRHRSWYLDARVASHVVDRNGKAGPTIWVDGRVAGSWVQRKDGTIAFGWLTDVPPARRVQVEATARVLEHELGDTRFTARFPAPIQSELHSV